MDRCELINIIQIIIRLYLDIGITIILLCVLIFFTVNKMINIKVTQNKHLNILIYD